MQQCNEKTNLIVLYLQYLKRYRPSEESFVHLPERSACTKEDKKVVEVRLFS